MRRFWLVIIISWVVLGCVYSQGLRVGVLVSRKQMSFDGYHLKYVASYILRSDSVGLVEEEARTAMTIRLGHLLKEWLSDSLKSKNVHFVNEGKAFEEVVRAYPFEENQVLSVPLDYILVVEKMHFGSERQRILYAVSNHLMATYEHERYIEGRWVLYKCNGFHKLGIFEKRVSLSELPGGSENTTEALLLSMFRKFFIDFKNFLK